MGFKCGIVGLPNVGKSTLFNALTQAGIQAENYPFCTIEPNVGIVPLPDARLDTLAMIAHSKKVIPTTMQFVDIAGLVAGAAQGEGLGNKFLAHIRETQAIAHVVRCFDNPDVTHVTGQIDPIADIETIHTELALADLETVSKAQLKASKASKSGDKKAKVHAELLARVEKALGEGHSVRVLSLTDEEHAWLASLHLLTSKPVLYIANVDEQHVKGNEYVERVKEHAANEQATVVVLCAAIESELAELPEEDAKVFLNEMGLKEPGLHRLIHAGYKLLGLHTYFTAGEKEARAWTIPKNSTAPQAAGAIHSDFEKGFIRAEVVSYEDYVQYQGEAGAKEAGKLRGEGRDYVVQEGDVIHFLFNV